MFGRIIEVTFTLIAMYIIIINADKFSTAANAVGGVYVNAVRALQGQPGTTSPTAA